MSDRPAHRRAACCSLAAATILMVAGCSGTSNSPTSTPTTAASTPGPSLSASATDSATPGAPTESTSPSSATGDATPASDPSASAAPAQALVSRDFTVNGTYTQTRLRMRLSVVELKRRGDLLDLKATLTNLERDSSRDLRWQVGSRFAGPYRQDITSSSGVFSGAVLTDVAGKKRYLVAADSGNECVCTDQLSSTFVGAGQTIELNATYAAPPAATTKLDVTITSTGMFRDLPVS